MEIKNGVYSSKRGYANPSSTSEEILYLISDSVLNIIISHKNIFIIKEKNIKMEMKI